MVESNKQPLLSPKHSNTCISSSSSPPPPPPPSSSINGDEEGDIKPIGNIKDFIREFSAESKKQLYLAGPATFIALCNCTLLTITEVFAGHIGTTELAAMSVQISVISGFTSGILLGMGSALETLCGQAFGAGQLNMLGIYVQRSWIILITTTLILMFLYIFATPILIFIGQTPEISKAVGAFTVWMIPQPFGQAINCPLTKFMQMQSKMMEMAVIIGATTVFHASFCWLLMLKLEMGLIGAAIVVNCSSWFLTIAQLMYVFSGSCGRAWSGFSWKVFHHLCGYIRLTLQSAAMPCLQSWYATVVVLFAGYMKNAELSVDAMSISMNVCNMTSVVAVGFCTSISIRVSNELGAAHGHKANFSVVVGAIYSSLLGLAMALILMITRNQYPDLFSDSEQVKQLVSELTPLIGVNIVISSVQASLSGAAIGAGWQAYVAYVNLGCYYLFGVPLGLVLAYDFNMDVIGIWYGMVSGLCLQTCFLLWMIYRTNWNKEAFIVGDRIKEWRRKIGTKENDEESKK
ncbi:protein DETOXIFICATION 30-like isoform X1 [Camellia sinensis]|uniref:protein DETOXIFICATION 30-like isoform X1 n=1 Tax=Camellia sinensis TaxID=4442 RepID=UPI001035C02E|nr:protein DETOXIFICATION 30-like isoform X1 [Camellia sinensis]